MQRGVPRQMGMGHDHEQMTPREMTRAYHLQTLWIPLLLLVLAVWLVTSPFTFGYADPSQAGPRVGEVTQARGLAPVDTRGQWTTVSDVASGALLAVFALLSLRPGRVWSRWAACLVGVWLLFAPLLLWAPTPAAYLNATLVGALVIALTILIPRMPGMMLVMRPGPEIPLGWSYNPSSWYQRAPLAALAWTGFFFSRYLAAYQLGYIDAAADPFFGGSTMTVLDSEVSMAFPVSDAGLGATAITFEALMAYMGGASRWRTMPWMVTFFGILVIPLGVAHVVLVMLQPVMVGAWCTFCLGAAGAMLVMIPLALDEVVAMVQFVRHRVREGERLWRVFIMGGTVQGGSDTDDRSPGYPAPAGRMAAAAVWGVSLPWTLAVVIAVGVWLTVSPEVMGVQGAAADANHLLGVAIVTVSVVATAEPARAGRYLNLPVAVTAALLPWLLGGADLAAQLATTVSAAAVIVLSLPRGRIHQIYGTANRAVR